MVTGLRRIHGGPDAQGVALHDFSHNANACGPCPQALAEVVAADPARYPDPGYTALRLSLADFHGVDAARIVVAGSGSEFIFRITGWAARQGGRTVSLPVHGYCGYALAAQAWGLETAPPGGANALAWACDPSSPLGAPQAGLRELAARGEIAVLDRAYEPLRLAGSLDLAAGSIDAMWQLWSPNKALGLTGVRGAYAIAPLAASGAVVGVEALAPSWLLGAHGVAMLQAWCQPAVQQWLADSLAHLREWKARQTNLCQDLGWTVLPSDANFFVCRPGLKESAPDADPEASLAALLATLRRRGIKLRDCASFGLPGHVRLGVQPPASQDALRRAWESLA